MNSGFLVAAFYLASALALENPSDRKILVRPQLLGAAVLFGGGSQGLGLLGRLQSTQMNLSSGWNASPNPRPPSSHTPML